MPNEGERVYMEKNGFVIWGTVLGAVDDGRLMIAWDEGNPLEWDASCGVRPEDVQLQSKEAV